MNASDRSVTQQDRVANPQSAADVAYIAPLKVLREATKLAPDLSAGATKLLTWVCLNARDYGCLFTKLDEVARELKMHRRILSLKRWELERTGWIRRDCVRKGRKLPNGAFAPHETTVLTPTLPTEKVRSQNVTSCRIHDHCDHGQRSDTLFCDQNSRREEPPPPLKLPDPEPKPKRQDPRREEAREILHVWRARLNPSVSLAGWAAEKWLDPILDRLNEGFSREDCIVVIEAHVHSPHNQAIERRDVAAVFGLRSRFERMLELGRAGATKKARIKTTMDPAKLLDAEHRGIAAEHGVRDVEDEWLKFRSDFASKGDERVDWTLVWVTWCVRAKQFQKRGGRSDERADRPSLKIFRGYDDDKK